MMTPPTQSPRRVAYIIWAALLLGPCMFAAVATVVGPGVRRGGAHGPDVLVPIALGLAVAGVLASRLVPPRLRAGAGVSAEAFAVSRNIVAMALCEGPGLFALIAWMLTGNAWAAAAAALAIVGLASCFPGDARWRTLVGDDAAARRASGGPSRMVR